MMMSTLIKALPAAVRYILCVADLLLDFPPGA